MEIAQSIEKEYSDSGRKKPLVVSMVGGERSREALHFLDEKGIPGSYDTVVLLGNTTGICRSVSDLELLIANLAGALNQGGSMMITFTDPAEFDRDDDTLLEFEALYKNEREKGSWFLAGPDSVETVISRYGVLEFADLREGLYGFSARKA